ncbi:MAG: GNAT family N-acetyltransferase [Polyangiaceae bacterium]
MSVVVRAAQDGEGLEVAALWRELWDVHESWGGYTGSRDPDVYAELARRLDDDARSRASNPVLGRHIHLVAADKEHGLVGQVEGWFERYGYDERTPFTCEVRSLVVAARARKLGAGRALLAKLEAIARSLSGAAPCVLAAEVLEPNPAHAFYERLGYRPVSWTTRIAAHDDASRSGKGWHARLATSQDAYAVATLEVPLAMRRRANGDERFDRAREVDASFVGVLAAHLGRARGPLEQCEIVAVDPRGAVRACASLTVGSLDPPFVPARRGLLGRFAIDPAMDCAPALAALVALARRLTHVAGAQMLELTDLDPPGTPMYAAALAVGAAPWSRISMRAAPLRESQT